MLRTVAAILFAVGTVCAATPTLHYDLRLAVVQDGKVIATQHAVAGADEVLHFASHNNGNLAWSADMRIVPDAHRANMTELNWTAQFADRASNGTLNTQRQTAVVALADPGEVAFTFDKNDRSMRVSLASQQSGRPAR